MGLVAIARLFLHVRETQGANKGVYVGLFQQYTDNEAGDSWCCSFVSLMLSIYYKGKSPLTKTARCQTMLDQARKLGLEQSTPSIGCLYFFRDATGHAHHIGIVTSAWCDDHGYHISGIAGNTSEDGKSSNGTGVFEHAITGNRMTFVRLPPVPAE